MVGTIVFQGNVFRIIHFQIGEKIVEGRRAIVLLVLNRRRPEHFHYHSEILLLLRRFIVQIKNKGE